MFILDTDSITHDQKAHPVLSEKVKNTPREQLFTTSVTIEEQLQGRLGYLNRHRNSPHESAQGHAALVETIFYFNNWNIILYSEEADAAFRGLRQQRVRIGSQDLRIAAIALVHAFTVVTRNRADFAQVPSLKVEDWTVASSA
jgi:tRNA(fMet)-specific endonuclease VapC